MASTIPEPSQTIVGGSKPDATLTVVLEQLKLYFDLYKHHWDLYLKAHVLFYAVVGALGGYLSKAEVTSHERTLLTSAMAVGACVACIASAIGLQWLKTIQFIVQSLEARLGALHYSFEAARRILVTLGTASFGIAVTAIVRLVLWK